MGTFEKVVTWVAEKLNPAQQVIYDHTGSVVTADVEAYRGDYTAAYNNIERVRRGVDFIVNGCISFDTNVMDKIPGINPIIPGIRKTRVHSLLNYQPNPYISVDKFRRNIYLDLVMEGNAFVYYDGAYLYNLPAINMEIIPDKKTYVAIYRYASQTEFTADEIMHISDNSVDTIYRGSSRLKSAIGSLESRDKMTKFQDNFFKNGAVPGLVLKSPNILGDKVKQRLIESWMREYNPTKGGKRPLVLDGGLDIDKITDVNFKELDFEQSVATKEDAVLVALGVPPILINGGNNANIQPNLRLFYVETVLPIVRSVNSGLERFFGYDLEPEVSKISALQPDMTEAAQFYSTLVNGGVLTPNEARLELRYEELAGHDDLRIPANIAGSAADPSQGGKPKDPKKDDNK